MTASLTIKSAVKGYSSLSPAFEDLLNIVIKASGLLCRSVESERFSSVL